MCSLVGGSPCCLHPVHVVPWLSASAGSQNTQPSVFPLSLLVTHSLLLFSHHALSAGSLLSLSVGPLSSLSVGYLMPLPVKHRLPLSLSVISCHSLLVDPSMSSTTGPSPLPRSWLVLFCGRLLPAPISRCPIRHVLSFLVGSFRRLVHLDGLTVCSRLK